MDVKDTIDKLSELAQLDIDAVHAYDQAMEKVEHETVMEHLRQYREDHDRHVTELSALIRELGGEPPDHSPDFKGYFIEGFTSMRSVSGTEGALKATQTNEKLTNKKYDDARSLALDGQERDLIEKNFEDERRHLEYIEGALDKQVWEAA
jgi:uncharacterized protein (TIGR02284 family)